MRRSEEEGVRRLLSWGWHLLRSGQAREAGDVFGRVLLRRPGQTEARRGAARARQELAEQYRLGEFSQASPRRRAGAASGSAPQMSPGSPTAQRRQPLPSAGRVATTTGLRRGVPRSVVWGRRVLLTGGALGLALALGILSLRWNALMAGLSRPPAPSSSASGSALALPADGSGQTILGEAHRKIERGDPAAARELLQSIGPEDPAYPFAQRLQLELPQRGDQR